MRIKYSLILIITLFITLFGVTASAATCSFTAGQGTASPETISFDTGDGTTDKTVSGNETINSGAKYNNLTIPLNTTLTMNNTYTDGNRVMPTIYVKGTLTIGGTLTTTNMPYGIGLPQGKFIIYASKIVITSSGKIITPSGTDLTSSISIHIYSMQLDNNGTMLTGDGSQRVYLGMEYGVSTSNSGGIYINVQTITQTGSMTCGTGGNGVDGHAPNGCDGGDIMIKSGSFTHTSGNIKAGNAGSGIMLFDGSTWSSGVPGIINILAGSYSQTTNNINLSSGNLGVFTAPASSSVFTITSNNLSLMGTAKEPFTGKNIKLIANNLSLAQTAAFTCSKLILSNTSTNAIYINCNTLPATQITSTGDVRFYNTNYNSDSWWQAQTITVNGTRIRSAVPTSAQNSMGQNEVNLNAWINLYPPGITTMRFVVEKQIIGSSLWTPSNYTDKTLSGTISWIDSDTQANKATTYRVGFKNYTSSGGYTYIESLTTSATSSGGSGVGQTYNGQTAAYWSYYSAIPVIKVINGYKFKEVVWGDFSGNYGDYTNKVNDWVVASNTANSGYTVLKGTLKIKDTNSDGTFDDDESPAIIKIDLGGRTLFFKVVDTPKVTNTVTVTFS